MSRIALITGGMGGLGEAICIKMAAMGYQVVTTYSPGNKTWQEWLAAMKQQGLIALGLGIAAPVLAIVLMLALVPGSAFRI